LTEDALEGKDARTLFKGRTAVVDPFLMALLRGIATDFVTSLTDDAVVEVVEWIDGEDRDSTAFWQLIL
jgi:hypothetical protein